MKNITIGQAKQILPIWLSFLNTISKSDLNNHPFTSGIMSLWEKYFVPVLDENFYQQLTDETNKDEVAMNETDLYIKRQKIKDYFETKKLTPIDIGLDETFSLEKSTEDELDSILDSVGIDLSDLEISRKVLHILTVREIDHKNQNKSKVNPDNLDEVFPNKIQFVVGVFSSRNKAVKWMKDNPGFHDYNPSDYFYALSWCYTNDFSPPIAEAFYSLNGDKL